MDSGTILAQFNFQRVYLSLLVDDIPDERMCEQPGKVVNHPAWQLGHIADSADQFVKLMGGKSNFDPIWHAKFTQGSVPTSKRGDYPSKTELMKAVDDARDALAKAVACATEMDLAKPNPIKELSAPLPTVGHLALFGLLFHESTHLGQLATWRSASGMVQAFSKLRM